MQRDLLHEARLVCCLLTAYSPLLSGLLSCLLTAYSPLLHPRQAVLHEAFPDARAAAPPPADPFKYALQYH